MPHIFNLCNRTTTLVLGIPPGTLHIEGWEGLGTSLDTAVQRKISSTLGIVSELSQLLVTIQTELCHLLHEWYRIFKKNSLYARKAASTLLYVCVCVWVGKFGGRPES